MEIYNIYDVKSLFWLSQQNCPHSTSSIYRSHNTNDTHLFIYFFFFNCTFMKSWLTSIFQRIFISMVKNNWTKHIGKGIFHVHKITNHIHNWIRLLPKCTLSSHPRERERKNHYPTRISWRSAFIPSSQIPCPICKLFFSFNFISYFPSVG